MKKLYLFCTALLLLSNSYAQDINIIPQPLSITQHKGHFVITATTKIYINNAALKPTALKLSAEIKKLSGKSIAVVTGQNPKAANAIILNQTKVQDSLGAEGYNLTVNNKQVIISGLPAGVFYGMQTVVQLLPVKEEIKLPVTIPVAEIIDKPRFAWRGMMLDVGRQFYPVAYIKRFIDYLAFHKLNTFHWHLVEDAGWRIEIKKYPLLTSIGACRAGTQWGLRKDQFDKTPNCGYYTQEQVKDVVKYAAERFITIVPEIEMPGHTLSSLATYPELSCTGGPFEVSKYWVRSYDIYCAGNEKTYEFLENVLSEVAALFPGQYIHIGGDEAPKDRWKVCPKCQARIKSEGLKNEHELQTYLIKRIENFLLTKHKKVIGWDEILEGGLAPNAAVMSWRGVAGGIAAAKQKHDVVMTPTTYLYFDYPQGDKSLEGDLAYGPLLPLEKVYAYEPIPKELNAEEATYIKGLQANVWSEFIHSPERVEYMSFPRGDAMAEVAWTYPQRKDWESFKQRLEVQYKRYDDRDVFYSKSANNVSTQVHIDTTANKASIVLKTDSYQPEIYYTINGTEPDKNSLKYAGTINTKIPVTIKAVAYKQGILNSRTTVKPVLITPAKKDAKK
jgi:hexosaminidase